MRILLTNDDGINSKGLRTLYHELQEVAQVTVVAPEAEQSAVGHAITISDPLRVNEVSDNGSFSGYAVSGTPADCVKLAMQCLVKEKPDLVLSGINIGSNTGINVIYSGTISGATEGTILGIPSIAVSLDSFINPDFGPAARFIKGFAGKVLKEGLPRGTLLNVNVPAVSEEEIEGVLYTKLGTSRFRDEFHRRTDPRGHVYYWQGGEMVYDDEDHDTDNSAIQNKKISITPIHYRLTDRSFLERMRSWE